MLDIGEEVEDDALSITDLDEQRVEAPVIEEKKELDPLDEITKNISGDTLVLNM